jgi:uncharacterized protein YqiB (DUF1249 family)
MSRFRPRNTSYWLAELCESNFRQLRLLLPDFATLTDHSVAAAHGKPPLYIKVIDRSRYTLTLELSHGFGIDADPSFEPSLCVRVYLDGKCAEALPNGPPGLPSVLKPDGDSAAVLDQKWSSNYFLQRWLEHCIRSRYRFSVVPERPESPAVA